jgi:mannose-6-phosphate isomerase
VEKILFLKNPIQEYPWGSKTAIQEFLRNNYIGKKVAELWLGAHPKAPSSVLINTKWHPLDKFIDKDPEKILGKFVAKKFSRKLPFLLKIIAVENPLSLQVHPGPEQAREGYLKENRLGLVIDSHERNFKDPNHKPEIVCALSQFDALNGFRPFSEIENFISTLFSNKAAGHPLSRQTINDTRSLKNFVYSLFNMHKSEQANLVNVCLKRAEECLDRNPAFKWIVKLGNEYQNDICVLAPAFLNLVHLKIGQAIYIKHGEFHTYLHGTGVELMANSDNVLRAGLTRKHIEIKSLLKILNFSPVFPEILDAAMLRPHEFAYPAVFDEFQLSVISTGKFDEYTSKQDRSIEILICMSGEAKIAGENGEVYDFRKGDSVIIPADLRSYSILGESTVYKASVPMMKIY